MSESSSVSEGTLATRLLTDLSVLTSSFELTVQPARGAGFIQPSLERYSLDYQTLQRKWEDTPGLASDKLKNILEFVWTCIVSVRKSGIVFAYDEAQNLADHDADHEYPLSLLLDVFQALQRKGIPFLLVLTGLPTLLPKLVDARTYSERMFHVLMLSRLSEQDTKEAIRKPIEDTNCPVKFTPESVTAIYNLTLGYPHFIQYVCRDVYDVWAANLQAGTKPRGIPQEEILAKLDQDFFAGRWNRATDRQRDLLKIIAELDTAASEFTVQEIVESSKTHNGNPFSSSHVNQMLVSLANAGLVYKNRFGKYSLAVPLLDRFIRRQTS